LVRAAIGMACAGNENTVPEAHSGGPPGGFFAAGLWKSVLRNQHNDQIGVFIAPGCEQNRLKINTIPRFLFFTESETQIYQLWVNLREQ